MRSITIIAHQQSFTFDLSEGSTAWYDLDQATATCNGWTLTINADREVYACLTEPNGCKYYGIISDTEDEALPDNFPVSAGASYTFFDHP